MKHDAGESGSGWDDEPKYLIRAALKAMISMWILLFMLAYTSTF